MDLTVNHAALDQASADLQTGAKGIQNHLDTMDADLQQLQSSWEGQAKEAYHVAKVKWTEGMTGMQDVLAHISQMVNSANQTYMTTDKQNAGLFS